MTGNGTGDVMWERIEGCCDGGGILELLTYVFLAGAITCFLMALHRIAGALSLGARVKVVNAVGVEIPEEQRQALVAKVTSRALHYM